MKSFYLVYLSVTLAAIAFAWALLHYNQPKPVEYDIDEFGQYFTEQK